MRDIAGSVLLGLVWIASCGRTLHAEEGLFLSENGQSRFQIVVPQGASVADRSAADALQYHLAEITGAQLPIVTETGKLPDHAILLGNNR